MRSTAVSVALAGLFLLSLPAFAQTGTPTPDPDPDATPLRTPMPEATPAPTPPPEAQRSDANVSSGAMKLKIGGVIWTLYRYELTEGAQDRNEFDLGRAYLNLYPSLSDDLDGRVTFDLVRQGAGEDVAGDPVETNTTGSLVVRVKYGFLAYHPIKGLDLILGLAPTPWVGYEEDIWGYRVTDSIGADEFYDVSSSDFGFGAKVKLLGKRVEIHTAAHNGEGYSDRERNKYKEIATRVAVQVIPADKGGLKLAGYYGYALTDQDADRVRAIGMASWQSKRLTGAAGYVMSQEGDGMGTHVTGGGPFAFGHVTLPFGIPGTRGSRVLARVDVVDPDADLDDDGLTRLIGGVALLVHDKSQIVLDYQQITFEAPDTDPQQLGFVHWELKF